MIPINVIIINVGSQDQSEFSSEYLIGAILLAQVK